MVRVLFARVLCFFSLFVAAGSAFAQSCQAPSFSPPSGGMYEDEGEAYSRCMAEHSPGDGKEITGYVRSFDGCFKTLPDRYQPRYTIIHRAWDCSTAYAGSQTYYGTYFFRSSCQARDDFVTEFLPRSGSYGCNGGCTVHFYQNADGTSTASFDQSSACDGRNFPESCVASGHTWNPVLNVCEPDEPLCPAGQSRNSLGQCAPEPCPAGKVLGPDGTCRKRENECPAGQVRGPDGSCVDNECPAGQVRGPDGTCKRDDDDDGNEDDADEEFFSGGDDCSTPPQCSGSPILCGQARIQWRIDCNTRKNRSISGGTCGAMPVCDGEKCDALEYSMLVQQWKAACALEKLAAGGGSGGGDGDNSDVIDFLGGPGTHNPNVVGGDTLTDAGPGDDEFDIPEPDSSGYGYSRTCPTPPSVTLPNGVVVNFDLAPLCQWVSLAGSIVLILAGLVSLRIVSGGTA